MELNIFIAILVIAVQLTTVGIVIHYFAKRPPAWKNGLRSSLELIGFMGLCFLGQHLIVDYLSRCNRTIVFDSNFYLNHELKVLQFYIAWVAAILAPISFGFWTYQRRTALALATKSRNYLIFGLAWSLSTSALVIVAVPEFGLVFKSFGSDLPIQTLILVAHYRWVGLLPLVVLLAWLNRGGKDGELAAKIGIVGSSAVLIYALWSCYLPVYFL